MPDPVPAIPDSGEMTRIVALLSETYTDDGVATVLSARHKSLSPDDPLIVLCRTSAGRFRVAEWAESLTGMVAT